MKPKRAYVLAAIMIAGSNLTTVVNGSVKEMDRPIGITNIYNKKWVSANSGGALPGTDVNTEPAVLEAAAGATGPLESDSAHERVSAAGSIDAGAILPVDRATAWNPGMMGVGGIPVRSTVCSALTPRGRALDDTAQSQDAINACPAGQVVQLTAGTFIINSGNFLLINKGISLRGAGPGRTTLTKTDGAKPFRETVGAKPSPL